MNKKQNRSVTVGIFVTLALVILVGTIYLIGKKENIFGSTITVSAIFRDVKGVREGDKVRLSGIDIGTVSYVWFLGDNRVIVELSLAEEATKFVKKDSRATIGNQGLMGSKVVMILPGSLQSEPVSESDTLPTIEQVDLDDILREVKITSENISVVSDELISITKKINRGDGIFGKIFTDTTITRNLDYASRNITEITNNLIGISEKVNRGQGIVGKLFTDTILSSEIDTASQDLGQIAMNLMEITDKVNKGEGIFGRLFTDTSLTRNLYLSSKNMEVTTKNLLDLTGKLNNDSSALNLFINDESFADSLQILLYRLDKGIEEATKAAEAVQKSGFIRAFSRDKEKKK